MGHELGVVVCAGVVWGVVFFLVAPEECGGCLLVVAGGCVWCFLVVGLGFRSCSCCGSRGVDLTGWVWFGKL